MFRTPSQFFIDMLLGASCSFPGSTCQPAVIVVPNWERWYLSMKTEIFHDVGRTLTHVVVDLSVVNTWVGGSFFVLAISMLIHIGTVWLQARVVLPCDNT